jgi:ribosomal-protein-alanine N-acetyltransferase
MLHFRKFVVKDWKDFNEITIEAFPEEGIQKEGFIGTLEDEGFIGGFIDNKLIGYLRLLTHKDYGHLGQIAVTKLERGKGYGNILMKYALDYFESKGMKRVGLYVETNNQPAISLYKKFGFEKQFESWHYWIDEDFYKQIEESNKRIENSELRVLTSSDFETILEVFPEINREELESHLNIEQDQGLTGVKSIPLGLYVSNELQIYGRLNPEFPGCRPFLVTDTQYVDEFISNLVRYNKKNFIRLTFDRNSKLAAFFEERGYKLHHHLYVMETKIPNK